MTTTGSKEQRAGARRYIEIVNWRKAQPRMAEGQNFWLKVYTDLLDDHAYTEQFDDATRVLIMAIWKYSARTGLHIFPADPAWLHKRIPWLSRQPDYKPLMEATDIYGRPHPFLRYCGAPASKDGQDGEFEGEGKAGGGQGKRPAGRKAGAGKGHPERPAKEKPPRKNESKHTEDKRREKREENKRTEPETLHPADSGFGETKEREILTDFSRERQSTAQQGRQEQTAAQAQQSSVESEKTEKPANPTESEAGQAQGRIVPMPAPSARGLGMAAVQQIIVEHIPAHWFDEDAEAFGWQIVQALGLPGVRGDRDARSDWGAFASWWCRVKAAAPPMALAELRIIAVGKAAYLFKKGRSCRKKQAVWFSIMEAELLHHGIRLPPARAAPLQHAGA